MKKLCSVYPTATVTQPCTHERAQAGLVQKVVPSKPPMTVKNRFSALSCIDEEPEAAGKPILGDFIRTGQPSAKVSQKDKKAAFSSGVNVRRLCPLIALEPEPLYSCKGGEGEEWELLDMLVDSGASETVVPPQAVSAVEAVPSDASRRGVMYEVANGSRIPNLGEKTFRASTEKGQLRDLTAQVAETNRPLLSVSRLVAAGNTVVFSPEDAYIQDAKGEKIQLDTGNGMYSVKLWVAAAKRQGQAAVPGF